MKKSLYRTVILSIVMLCVFAVSACNMEGNQDSSANKIDNLQEYLPNLQTKVIAVNMDYDYVENVYEYRYEKNNRADWSESTRINGQMSSVIFGYDYYDASAKELRQNITSDNSPTRGDYPVLISEIGKKFTSYDGTRTIISDNESVTTPYGNFDNCIYVKVENDSSSEPYAFRYYAPEYGYVYGIAKLGEGVYYEDYMCSYMPLTSEENENTEAEGDVDDLMDNIHRWYLKKTTFENTETNHTLYVEVAGDTLRFIMDGQFLAGTALLDETDYFPDYNGYTANEENGTFTVRYYPDKEYIRIIDKVNDRVDYSGIYEYKNR